MEYYPLFLGERPWRVVSSAVDYRADAMLQSAMAAYEEKRFEDTAYFETFYLKQLIAAVSANNSFDSLRQRNRLGCYM